MNVRAKPDELLRRVEEARSALVRLSDDDVARVLLTLAVTFDVPQKLCVLLKSLTGVK